MPRVVRSAPVPIVVLSLCLGLLFQGAAAEKPPKPDPLEGLAARVEALEARCDAQGARLTEAEAQVATLTGAVSDLGAQLAGLSGLPDQVAALGDRVTALEGQPPPPQPWILQTTEPAIPCELSGPIARPPCDYRLEFECASPAQVLVIGTADFISVPDGYLHGRIDLYIDGEKVGDGACESGTHGWTTITIPVLASLAVGTHTIEMSVRRPWAAGTGGRLIALVLPSAVP